jgi:hypothetical protein
MKKQVVIIAGALTLLSLALGVSIAQENKGVNETQTQATNSDAKSVAWYVANIRAARTQNQQCFDHPELKETENCQNSLHALQISFNGNN